MTVDKRPSTWKQRAARAASNLLDRLERLGGERFYQLHLAQAAKRHRHGADIIEIMAGKREIRFRTPTLKARWRAETMLRKEPMTIQWIDRFDAAEVFWDIGANIGIYSLYAAMVRRVATLAFEPASHNFALLCDNIRLNAVDDKVSAYNLAFWNMSGLGRLVFADDEPGAALATVHGERGKTEAALLYEIDEFVERFKPPFPTHIKIDVDGAEEEILKGAAATLADPRLKSLLIEVEERDPERPRRIDGTLAAVGFALEDTQKSPLAPRSAARNRTYRRQASWR